MEDEKNLQTPEEGAEQAAEAVDVADAAADEAAAADATPDDAAADSADAAAADKAAAADADDVMADLDAQLGDEDDPEKVVNPEDESEDDAEAKMLAMLNDLPDDDSSPSAEDIQFPNATVAPAEFQQLSEPAGQGEARNIDLLLDVNLPIAIELGRTRMAISDILALGPGSVVELNKLAGEPVDLLVNGKIVARGEVVVIDENFGVRITNLLSTEERLRVLGDQ